MGDLVTFCGSISADVHDYAITSMYKCAYFAGLIFTVHESTMKTAKIGPLENFPLYRICTSIIIVEYDYLPCCGSQKLYAYVYVVV